MNKKGFKYLKKYWQARREPWWKRLWDSLCDWLTWKEEV